MEFGKAASWSDARVGCKSLSAVLEGAQGRAYNGLLFAVVGAKGIHDKIYVTRSGVRKANRGPALA